MRTPKCLSTAAVAQGDAASFRASDVKDWLEAAGSLLEIPAKIFFAIAAVAGSLLVLAVSPYAHQLGLANAPPAARFWLTVTTVSATAIALVKIASNIGDRRKGVARGRKHVQQLEQAVASLNSRERTILLWHVMHGTASFTFATSAPSASQVVTRRCLRSC